MKNGYFVTGTDTGVGKTFFTALWLRTLRNRGVDAVGFKPVCCGDREDAELLHAASGKSIPIEEINPVWLKAPASPSVAADLEGKSFSLRQLIEAHSALAGRHDIVLVEGVGGWRVPLTPEYDSRDLARELGLPVVIVVRNRLGAINHTVLTLESIAGAALPCAGIILNHVDGEPGPEIARNGAEIERMTGVPVLAEIHAGQTVLNLEMA